MLSQAAGRLLFACLLLLAANPLPADTFKIENPGQGFAAIQGKWQFHTGDDLAWAEPAYDDSQWEQLSGDTTWGAQSHPGYTGFAWYRKRIEVGGDGQPLALLIPPVTDAYEVYWNGRKIGNYGRLPPHADWVGQRSQCRLPAGQRACRRPARTSRLEGDPHVARPGDAGRFRGDPSTRRSGPAWGASLAAPLPA